YITPVFVFVDLAAHGFDVLGGDRLGHRARARDRAVVDRIYRADLGRGATHEHLFRDVEITTREVVDAHLETVVARDRRHGVLCDTGQRARRGRRGDEHAAPRREDVLAGALGHETFRVEHDRLVVTGLERFDLRERRVHVVAGRLRQR